MNQKISHYKIEPLKRPKNIVLQFLRGGCLPRKEGGQPGAARGSQRQCATTPSNFKILRFYKAFGASDVKILRFCNVLYRIMNISLQKP